MNTDIKNMTELENNNSQYTKVTLAEIDQNPEAYNGARVEYTGVLKNGFERALIDGAIWFGGFVTPGDYEKNKLEYDKIPDKKDSTHTVHIKGILYTKNENGGTEFGHLGAARYELKATEFSVLD